MSCGSEAVSAHHASPWGGFGVVVDSETIAFALFSEHELREPLCEDQSKQLINKSWIPKELRRCEHSVARLRFTSVKTFDRCVVQPVEKKGKHLVGVCAARTERVRRIEIHSEKLERPVRAFQVLDRVSSKDFDGHASIGYADWPTFPERTLASIRAQVHLDLTKEFFPITPITSQSWGYETSILLARLKVVFSVAANFFLAALGLYGRFK